MVGVGAIHPECAMALEGQDAPGGTILLDRVSAREYSDGNDGAPTSAGAGGSASSGFGLVASAMVRTWRTALGVGGREGSSIVLTDRY
jgi:hypothetical protein